MTSASANPPDVLFGAIVTTLTAPTTPTTLTDAEKVRVLVVDDSLIYRKVVRDVLAAFPHVEVVGSAANGRMAIEKIEQFSPDMITLDFEMPELDGLGVLKWLRQSKRPTKAVMLSASRWKGAMQHSRLCRKGRLISSSSRREVTPARISMIWKRRYCIRSM